jgi:hypothetical protein
MPSTRKKLIARLGTFGADNYPERNHPPFGTVDLRLICSGSERVSRAPRGHFGARAAPVVVSAVGHCGG